LIGYPFLIAASGLFFRVRLVLFTTLVSLIAYSGLLISRPSEAIPYQYPVLFSATLAVLGFVVAHQVYRIRALSRYYEHRRLP
jgi:serine/threonine-protein kinase